MKIIPTEQLDERVDLLGDAELVAALEDAFAARRIVDSTLVRLAGEIVDRSRRESGSEGLARSLGSATPAALVAESGRISLAEAGRICAVGRATGARSSLLGERLPPAYPIVASAVDSAAIPIDSAAYIVWALKQASPRAQPKDLIAAEEALVEFARSHSFDFVRKLAIRWRDALDPDGVEPREDELRARRMLRQTVRPNGMRRYTIDLDPAASAYFDAVIDAEVGAELRASRGAEQSGEVTSGIDGARVEVAQVDGEAKRPAVIDDRRSIGQAAADALVDAARHVLGCDDVFAPLVTTTVVVRMTLDALLTGLGEATIDGAEQPISAATARRLAADGGIIPVVLGGESEVLDLGRTRRLFSRAQRIALAERDDGCAWPGCRRTPRQAEAHHIEWWSRGGTTALKNGVLLCTMHHHRVHDDGWGIEVKRGVAWFIPPPWVDPQRRPRRGGRRAEVRLPSADGVGDGGAEPP